jgi:peroxiredoxin
MIAVEDKLPEATLSYFDKEGNVQSVTVSELTKEKLVVLFAVPGVFTPTCSSKHLPGFMAKAKELCKAGVDTLACVLVNDAFVMQAWGKSADVRENVLMFSDGLGKFTQALGATVDLTNKFEGLGVRSRRYSMLEEDGVVKVLNLEEGGAFTNSSAKEILSSLQKTSA